MEGLFFVTRKRTAIAAAIGLFALMAQRPVLAQGAAQADPLKFTAATPVIIGWKRQGRQDQGLRGLLGRPPRSGRQE
jgi:hypothetical protein